MLHPSTCYQLQDKDENHPQAAMQKQPPSPFSTSYHLSLQNSGNCGIPYRQLDPQGSTNGIPEPQAVGSLPAPGCWDPPFLATRWQIGEEQEAQKGSAFTFSIQHLGDVQVFLCHIKGRVQICEWVILGHRRKGLLVRGMTSHWLPPAG